MFKHWFGSFSVLTRSANSNVCLYNMALKMLRGSRSLTEAKHKSAPFLWQKYRIAKQSCFFLSGSWSLAKMSNFEQATKIGRGKGCTLCLSSLFFQLSSIFCCSYWAAYGFVSCKAASDLSTYSRKTLNQYSSDSKMFPGSDKSATMTMLVESKF